MLGCEESGRKKEMRRNTRGSGRCTSATTPSGGQYKPPLRDKTEMIEDHNRKGVNKAEEIFFSDLYTYIIAKVVR